MKPAYTFLILFSILFFCIGLTAEAAESTPAHLPDTLKLGEVEVVAKRKQSEVIPVQVLSGEELQKLNSNSVADALRYFSGVQIKDCGGVGGIKTVNIRSMGTNHTGVVYDGVQLGNAQNGQIDLGQFSLDNIEAISLHNGQKSEILQPARDFGSAGSIYMRTRTPHFEAGESYHARASVRFGSFDLLNPSALVELKLSERVNASLSAEWVNSSGKYKFRYRRVNPAGELAYDTTAVRQNGDINATRIELNLNGDIIATKNVHWNVGLNLTWQRNRIEYIPSEKAGLTMDGHRGYTSGSYFYGEGLPMYTFYTKRFAGVNENGESMFYRKNSDGQLETTTTYSDGDYFLCGNAMPKVFGGFNTSLNAFGVDLAMQFNYSIGGKKWDTGYQALMSAPTKISIGAGLHRDVFKSWTPENPSTSIPMFYYSDVYGAAGSDRFLTDASYLTLRNVTLGYTFPKSITDRLKMTKLRVFCTCENVAYWTKRKGFDPRTSLTDGSYGGWPPMRTISGGIQVQF